MSDENLICVTRVKPRVIEVIARGPQGPSSAEIALSSDPNNRATTGGDGGIYVPDGAAVDPVAYYILAKS